MRLPVVPQISTKDGTSNRNARLTNCLKESKKTGDKAVVRPGLVTSDTYTGAGNGLIPFDGRLLVIYDDTVYDTTLDETYPWPLDSPAWVAGTYGYGETVWYGGFLWFSQGTSGTPGVSGWVKSLSYEYDEGATYDIGDMVTYNGTTYYSMMPANTGNNPTTPAWETTTPTTARYQGDITATDYPLGAECGSILSAAYAAYLAGSHNSCATKYSSSSMWYTFEGVSGSSIRLHQWIDPSPSNCSGAPLDAGVASVGAVVQTHV